MRRLSRLLVTLLIMLSGCTHNSIKQPHQKVVVDNHHQLTKWWSSLHDARLNTLVAYALAHNNQILSAKANILKAQAELKAAHNVWLPTLNASANAFWLKGWDTHSTPQGVLTQNPLLGSVNNFKVNANYTGFVPNYTINILENTQNARLARSSLARQRALYRSVQLSVVSQTVGAYCTLLGLKEQLKAQQQIVIHLQQLRHLEKIRYHDGANDYSRIPAIDEDSATNKAALASIQQSISHVQNTLSVLTNRPVQDVFSAQSIYAISAKQIIPRHLAAKVLAKRPDIMIAKEELISSDAHLGLAYARFFPQISLTGLLGGSSVELVRLLQLTTGLGVAQITAQMPIFNAALYQQIHAAKAGFRAAYYAYLNTLRAALAEVDDSLTANKKSSEAYYHAMAAYKASQRSYRLVFTRYSAGMDDRRAVINARLHLDQARINRIMAKIDELNSIVAVYQAVAGG